MQLKIQQLTQNFHIYPTKCYYQQSLRLGDNFKNTISGRSYLMKNALKINPKSVTKLLFLSFLLTNVNFKVVAQDNYLNHNEFAKLEKLTKQSSISELQNKMKSNQITATKLTKFYLQKIDRENSKLNAIISINPKALDEAKRFDKERAAGKVRGLLHGIPIVVKDNIETINMPTTAGSLALKDNHTNRDATLIKNLKQAGAIILAKSNLSEWANFRTERSSSGWSAIGGQTRNPLDLNRSACGSSSGSAAAVAANLAVAAVGTETDGSITCPSSANGIVGIKPTVGLVSRFGIVPLAHSQDTAGPMAKSVADAAILLSAMQGKDKLDPATLAQSFNFKDAYQTTRKSASLKGLRIGILESRVKPHEGVEKVYQSAIDKLKKAGVIMVPDLKVERYEEFGKDSYSVLLYEFKNDINQYLKSLPNKLNTLNLEKLIEFNQANAEQEMLYFQQEIFIKAQAKGLLTDKTYTEALSRLQNATRKEGLDKLVKDNQLDIIISPTLGPAWSIDKINGDQYTGGYSSYSAISGYPYLTLPMGKVHHLPIGLSVIGLARQDGKIIDIAKAMEVIFK